MALIGAVALVVIGPKKLPGVARTAGALFGRAQRYVNDVKAEVMREIELDELKKMRTEFETAARDVETTIHDNVRQTQSELTEAFGTGETVATGTGAAEGSPLGALGGDAGAGSGADSGHAGGDLGSGAGAYADSYLDRGNSIWRGGAPASKRKNWRVKQTATPVWYKRASGRRTRVQSGAARVARHTPSSMRRPTRFL
jgi:sec-independent protein translocase protein TatB